MGILDSYYQGVRFLNKWFRNAQYVVSSGIYILSPYYVSLLTLFVISWGWSNSILSPFQDGSTLYTQKPLVKMILEVVNSDSFHGHVLGLVSDGFGDAQGLLGVSSFPRDWHLTFWYQCAQPLLDDFFLLVVDHIAAFQWIYSTIFGSRSPFLVSICHALSASCPSKRTYLNGVTYFLL